MICLPFHLLFKFLKYKHIVYVIILPKKSIKEKMQKKTFETIIKLDLLFMKIFDFFRHPKLVFIEMEKARLSV